MEKNNDNQTNLPTYFLVHCALIQDRWMSFKNTYSFKTNLTNHQQITVSIDGGELMYTTINWHKKSHSDS